MELAPQNAYIRRLQHQMAERANLVSRSRGREPYRRVRLYPDAARRLAVTAGRGASAGAPARRRPARPSRPGRRRRIGVGAHRRAPRPPPTPPDGLLRTPEVERRPRRAVIGNTPRPPTTRTYAQIVRENVFTFINNVLFVLGVALVAGRPARSTRSSRSASSRRTSSSASSRRSAPSGRSTGSRCSRDRRRPSSATAGARSSARSELVRRATCSSSTPATRSCSTAALVDGHDRQVDESQLTGESRPRPQAARRRGVLGQLRVSGARPLRRARRSARASLANQITAGARTFRRVLTPLQREINLVIRVVLRHRRLPRGAARPQRPRQVAGDRRRGRPRRRSWPASSPTACSCRSPSPTPWARSGSCASARSSSSRTRSSRSATSTCCAWTRPARSTANRLAVEAVAGLGDATEDEAVAALGALAASRDRPQQDDRGDRGRAGRPTPRDARRGGAVLVGPQVERGRVRATPTRARLAGASRRPGIDRAAARRRSCSAIASRDGADGEPGRLGGASRRRTVGLDATAGLRVLLVAAHPDAAALPPDEDEATATLPDGDDAARPGRARATSCAPRPRRRSRAFATAGVDRQDHLRRRPRDGRRARPPGRPRAPSSAPSRARSSTALDDAALAAAADETDGLRADHAGPEGAPRRRAPRRAATTSR